MIINSSTKNSHESLPRDPLRRLCSPLQQVHLNVDVKSIYLHDTRRDLPDQIMEGEQGWVLQGVLSRAIFRRPPVSGQKYFTVLSLHITNIYATLPRSSFSLFVPS